MYSACAVLCMVATSLLRRLARDRPKYRSCRSHAARIDALWKGTCPGTRAICQSPCEEPTRLYVPSLLPCCPQLSRRRNGQSSRRIKPCHLGHPIYHHDPLSEHPSIHQYPNRDLISLACSRYHASNPALCFLVNLRLPTYSPRRLWAPQ